MRIYSENTIFEFVFAQWPSREEEENLSPYISYSSSLDVEKNSRGLRRGKNDHIIVRASSNQKWNLQKSACDDGVKIELRPVLAKFRANLSFPALKMLLSGL